MLILSLVVTPLIGLLTAFSRVNYSIKYPSYRVEGVSTNEKGTNNDMIINYTYIKSRVFKISIITLLISVIIFILFDFSNNQFQFVREY